MRNDPLAGMSRKLVWLECVYASNEPTSLKLFLVAIGRFFDEEATGSSMSYAQVAKDCSLHERQAKRLAKAARDRWLRIGVHKGFRSSKGNCNLYTGIIPAGVVERVRLARAGRTWGDTNATLTRSRLPEGRGGIPTLEVGTNPAHVRATPADLGVRHG